VKIVKNLGSYCALACLESYSADKGYPRSLQEIRDLFLSNELCDSDGTVHSCDAFVTGCQLLGINAVEIDFHYPIRDEYCDGSLFIFTTKVTNHCFRFFAQDELTKIIVMDPDWRKNEDILELVYMDELFLRQFEPRYFRLTIMPPDMKDEMDISKLLGIKETDFRLVIGTSRIDYDVEKEEINRKKHGYSLESAVYMLKQWLLPLGGPPPISKGPIEVNGEIRHLHMGIDNENNVVFIVTTMRPNETVRVISFRRASEEESEIYYQITGYKNLLEKKA
jgi:uncharacterized DUF497 family protein